jgi:Hint-domain
MKFLAFLLAAVVWPLPTESGASLNCFSGAALVSMADGTLRPIANVQEGDVVLTGTGIGPGVVTRTVRNPVMLRNQPDVIVVTTELGELVGTGNHPVWLDGTWQLLGDVASTETVPPTWSTFVSKVERKQQRVDVLYDLEIDGNLDDHASSHSYVVNGVVVFGKLLQNFNFGAENIRISCSQNAVALVRKCDQAAQSLVSNEHFPCSLPCS